MEIKEAVEALRFYQRKLYNGIYREKIGAFDVAISALEKQEGQKPQRREGTTYVFCPACGRPNIDDYCPRCGQKIDWSE